MGGEKERVNGGGVRATDGDCLAAIDVVNQGHHPKSHCEAWPMNNFRVINVGVGTVYGRLKANGLRIYAKRHQTPTDGQQ
jgi:hypothetical protein